MTLVTAPPVLGELVAAVHAAVRTGHPKQATIGRVAAELRASLPSPEMVPPAGDPGARRFYDLPVVR